MARGEPELQLRQQRLGRPGRRRLPGAVVCDGWLARSDDGPVRRVRCAVCAVSVRVPSSLARAADARRCGDSSGARAGLRAAARSRAVEFSLPRDSDRRSRARNAAGVERVAVHRALRAGQPSRRRAAEPCAAGAHAAGVLDGAGGCCRSARDRQAPAGSGDDTRLMLTRRAVFSVLAFEGLVFLGMGVVVADVRAHKRLEQKHGVNARGFRGRLTIHKIPHERRVAIVGGTAAYGYAVDWPTSLGPTLQNRLEQGWRKKYRDGDVTGVVNLAELGAGASSYIETLRRYAYLAPEVVIVY